jgi:hypothetical protein
MRERIESALTWLEDHGLLQYLYTLFMHEDGLVSMSLRDMWTFKELTKEIDDNQQAAIVANLFGRTVNVINGTTARTYYLTINDKLRLQWTVFFKRHESTHAMETKTTVIGQEDGE